jgi:DNA-binding transcriptional LysR family regulator
MTMNIHHLELFYFVAKYEGITAAVRKMPYGIQQPAVSGQILQLEKQLGVKLFNRRPFALTPSGEELYDYLYPFFSRLSEVEARLKGEESRHLRIAASASVLKNHLPEVLSDLRKREPDLRLTLREVEPADIHNLLANQQVDLAVSIMYGKLTEGLQAAELMKLPLVMLVPDSIKARRFSDLLEDDEFGKGKVGKFPLVGLPLGEIVSKLFQEELDARQIQWAPSVEVESLAMVAEYAARDFGVGISVSIPGVEPPKGLREVKLRDFAPVRIGVLYQGTLKPLASEFLAAARKKARSLSKKR